MQGDLEEHLIAFSRGNSFPSLDSIRLHDLRLGGTDPFITDEQIALFERCLPVLRGLEIKVVGYNNQPLDTWIQNREYENPIAEVEDDGSNDFIYTQNSVNLRLLLERERWRQRYLDGESSVPSPFVSWCIVSYDRRLRL